MSENCNLLTLLLLSAAVFFRYATCVESTTALPAPSIANGTIKSIKTRSLRLPNSTFPLHYHWHVTTNIHKGDLDFIGNVTIDVKVKESTDEIVLHAKRLRNFNISCFDLETGTQLQDLTFTHDKHTNFLIIHAVEYYQVFEAAKKYRLQILYEGTINDKIAGFYWLAYEDQNNKTIYNAATQFEPTSARLALPCYDEPAFKANFTIRVTHAKIYNVISNMNARKIIEHSGTDLLTTTFFTTPVVSTYLVAIVVSNFDFISQEYRNVTHRLYTPPSCKNKGWKELKFSIRTLTAIEDYLGIRYPLSKLDHIALNKNHGSGMENWGLITYKESQLLHKTNRNVYHNVEEYLTLVHEVLHQWFGDLVSPEWWSYAWLNEGFATYFAHIFIDMLHPEYKSIEYFLVRTANNAYSYNDFKPDPHPITHYVETEKGIASIFDTISYSKSACVIRMFHHAFNQQTFMDGVRLFLKKYQYSVVNETNLFESLQTAVEDDPTLNEAEWRTSVANIMASWTQSKLIPVVHVIRNYEDNTITIRQQSRYPNHQEHWWIPLNFATPSNNNFSRTTADYIMPPIQEIILNPADFGIELKANDWLVVNKQQTGFYPVIYDNENLRKIALALQQNHLVIHEFNRANLFQHLHSALRHNEYSIDVIFELLKYLINEDNLFVWSFVSPFVELLGDNLYGTESYELFQQFLKQIIKPIYHKAFANEQASKTLIFDVLHISVLSVACKFDMADCLDYTRQLGFDYIFESLDFQNDTFDFYYMDIVLCSACKYLSDEEFNAIVRIVSTPEHSHKHFDTIHNLRCTQNEAQIRKYVDLIIGPNCTQFISNRNDSSMYINYLLLENTMARRVMWQYISDHYETLVRLPDFLKIFNTAAVYVPTQERNQFNDLHRKIKNKLQSMGDDYSSGLIDINSPIIGNNVRKKEKFLERFGHDIHDWLTANQVSASATFAASMTTTT